jgi:hypothetical protein
MVRTDLDLSGEFKESGKAHLPFEYLRRKKKMISIISEISTGI